MVSSSWCTPSACALNGPAALFSFSLSCVPPAHPGLLPPLSSSFQSPLPPTMLSLHGLPGTAGAQLLMHSWAALWRLNKKLHYNAKVLLMTCTCHPGTSENLMWHTRMENLFRRIAPSLTAPELCPMEIPLTSVRLFVTLLLKPMVTILLP